MIKKHREPCILFLEDVFAESHAERLRSAGYVQVERFRTHFPDGKPGSVEQSVKDPRIIKLCAKNNWVLVTVDSNMEKTHCELIKQTEVTILASAHNHADDMKEWVEGLILAKASLEAHFKKTPRPWCATFSRNGKITMHVITQATKSRRNRPKEM